MTKFLYTIWIMMGLKLIHEIITFDASFPHCTLDALRVRGTRDPWEKGHPAGCDRNDLVCRTGGLCALPILI